MSILMMMYLNDSSFNKAAVRLYSAKLPALSGGHQFDLKKWYRFTELCGPGLSIV